MIDRLREIWRALLADDRRRCPDCGSFIPRDNGAFCPECGTNAARVWSDTEADGATGTTADEEMDSNGRDERPGGER